MTPGLRAILIQALGSAATLGAAAFVAWRFGLAAQGEFGLLRSWYDAATALAALGLPQGLLHLQYREGIAAQALRRFVGRTVAVVAIVAVPVVALVASGTWVELGEGRRIQVAVVAAAVPFAVGHLLWRALILKTRGVVRYSLVTGLPSLLVFAGVVAVGIAGLGRGFEWILFGAAVVGAAVAAASSAAPAPAAAASPRPVRLLWSVSLQTWVQGALAALLPALLLSLARALGASLAEVGLLSLGLYLYQLFGVLAAYAAPIIYDRVAGRPELADLPGPLGWPRARQAGIAGACLAAALLAPRLASLVWPATSAQVDVMTLFAVAGLAALGARIGAALLQAQGRVGELSVQAGWRLVAVLALCTALAEAMPVSLAGPLALLLVELATVARLGWVLKRGAKATTTAPAAGGARPLLVLVTQNYPYRGRGGETMFVAPEVERLARSTSFEVCVAPLDAAGAAMAVPAGVTVDRRAARAASLRRPGAYLGALRWPGFAAEMRRASSQGGVVGLLRVWRWAAQAHAVHQWARQHFPPGRPVLFYTYWRGGATLALARVAAGRPRTAAVTRVHGHDLYEARFKPPFQPWPSIYAAVDAVYAISAHGRDHLVDRGVDPARVSLHRLGVDGIDTLQGPSQDGVMRIVSSSFMLPLKRVPRIAAALVALAGRHPGRRLRWTHFGGGADMAAVRAVSAEAPANLEVRLAGTVDNATVRAHYAHEPVDLQIMLSEMEGLPVSIQEALAAGVPVLATAVGGVPEAVGRDNGALLDADPSVDVVVAALEGLLFDADTARRASRREAALQRWQRDFDAERNHSMFAAELARRAAAL